MGGPSRPLGSPDIPQFHLPADGSGSYAPMVYGAARIHFADRRRGVDESRRLAFVTPISPTGRTLDWDAARPIDIMPDQLVKEPSVAAPYLPLSAAAMETPVFTRWARSFDRWLARTQRVELVSKQEPSETVTVGPKRGGVSVELVAIVWKLT